MEEYVTDNGLTLFWKVNYDKGGTNYFTAKSEPRGFTLIIQRNRNSFKVPSTINDPNGAVRVFLHEVGRYSKKQEAIAKELALVKVSEVVRRFGL